MACQVAKSMGLQRRPTNNSQYCQSEEEDARRTQLFWALYVMDKERTFMTGVPCDLYYFDSGIQLIEEDPGTTLRHFSMAQYHLMLLWEETYVSLYSSRAMRSASALRHRQVSRLSTLFREWGLRHKTLLNATCDIDDIRHCLQLELKYCFHIGQILILQNCRRDENSRERRISSMYSALDIIKQVHSKCSTLAYMALLGRSVSSLAHDSKM